MKKTTLIILCAILCISLCACSRVTVSDSENGTFRFVYEDKNIETELPHDDLDTLIEIFDGRLLYTDNPSCSFSEDCSVVIGDQTFCIACDSCNLIYLLEEDKYFFIPEEDNNTLRQILTSYGAVFPCV